MNQPLPQLDRVFDEARKLTAEQQAALASEIEARVAELRQSHLSDAQRGEIEQRLAQPARHASAAQVKAFFARHGVLE